MTVTGEDEGALKRVVPSLKDTTRAEPRPNCVRWRYGAAAAAAESRAH